MSTSSTDAAAGAPGGGGQTPPASASGTPEVMGSPTTGGRASGGQAARGSTSTRALARSSTVMAAGTAVSRVLGLVKAMVLATAIGVVGPAADTFDIANRLPNIVYLLIAGGVLNAVLVPQIVRAAQDPDGGKRFVDRLVTLAVVGLAVVTGICLAAAPLLVRLYAGSWGGAELALATAFALWVLPQVFFYGLYTVLGQILNARGSFGPYMWAPAVNNVVAIAGLAVFIGLHGRGDAGQHALGTWSPEMVALLAGTATLGVVAQALVLLVPLRRVGFTWTPRLGVRGVGLRSAGTVALWTFAGILVSQAGYVVTTQVAVYGSVGAGEPLPAGAEPPGPAVLGYAYLLYVLPHSLVAVSVVTALFTRLSRRITEQDEQGARADMSSGLRLLGLVSVLSATGLVVLGVPAGVLVVGDPDSGAAVGRVVAAMALGLPFYSALYLLQRGFYAREDGRRPFVVVVVASTVSAVLNVVVALVAPAELVVVGLGLAQSAGNIAGLATALVLLHRRTGSFEGHRVLRLYVRVLIAAVLAGLAGWGASTGVQALLGGISGRSAAVAVALVAGSVIVVLYVLLLRLMRVTELDDVRAQLRR